MNLGLKNTLVIIRTLLLGVVIGFLVSGRLTRMRIENMRQDFARQGMDYRFMRTLKPSPEQLEDIRPIFDKYNEIRREQFEEHLQSKGRYSASSNRNCVRTSRRANWTKWKG